MMSLSAAYVCDADAPGSVLQSRVVEPTVAPNWLSSFHALPRSLRFQLPELPHHQELQASLVGSELAYVHPEGFASGAANFKVAVTPLAAGAHIAI